MGVCVQSHAGLYCALDNVLKYSTEGDGEEIYLGWGQKTSRV